ncbi:hypothetical protein Lser_V15G31324 [Lactuca serriola]
MDAPFVVLESASTRVTSPPSVFIDPLETVHKMNKYGSTNAGVSRGVFDFDYIGALHGFGKHAPAFPTETNNKEKDQSPYKEGLISSTRRDPTDKSSFRFLETQSEKAHVEDFQDSQEIVFDMPPVSKTSHQSVDQTVSPPSYTEIKIPLFTQTQGQQARLLATLALGDLFQNETLARSADAIVACRALVNLLEDQHSEEMKVVVICALQNLVMHSRSNKRAVAEARGVQVVLDLIGSGDTDTSIQAAMFITLLFSNNTIQEYASSETVRAITAAIEKDLWATGTVHEEYLKALNALLKQKMVPGKIVHHIVQELLGADNKICPEEENCNEWLLDGLAGLSTKHGHLCFYGNCVVCKADDSSATALNSSDASKALYEIMRVESRLKETTSRLEQQLAE